MATVTHINSATLATYTMCSTLEPAYFERTSVSRGNFLSLLIAGLHCLLSSASSSAVTSSSAIRCSTSKAISAAVLSLFFFFLPPLKSCLISSSSPSSACKNQKIDYRIRKTTINNNNINELKIIK